MQFMFRNESFIVYRLRTMFNFIGTCFISSSINDSLVVKGLNDLDLIKINFIIENN